MTAARQTPLSSLSIPVRSMKIWASEHVFHHPWDTVVQASWRKYPNPMNPAVIGTDIIDRRTVNGTLYTHRLLTTMWKLPGFFKSIAGSNNVCYASEVSVVQPALQRMKIETHNLTFGSLVAIDEKLTYEPHPQDPSKTLLKQEAVVKVQGIPLCSYAENLLTSNISNNASKGRQAIEWVIDKIEKEMCDIKNTAVRNTDEILTQTKKSFEELTTTARKSMDEISHIRTADDYNVI